ncbi:hypothetical protein CR3_2688 [Cupriavidus gilardii CR3]|nr:hypothetical protein CR3_2688 [Cupriavidus gilardii CR3]
MPYFSGQGRVYIGARDAAGNPQGLSFVGNVPELKVSLSVETLEHQESTSGQRLTDLQLIKTKKGEFACTLEELIAVNLGLALYGTTIEQVSGTVTAEALPNPVTAGSLYLLAKQNVSSVVVKDASGTPKTLPPPSTASMRSTDRWSSTTRRRAAPTWSRSRSTTPMEPRNPPRCSRSRCRSAGCVSKA